MRGKVVALAAVPGPPGITPAYAGKRSIIDSAIANRADHPRVCGEKDAFGLDESGYPGSPPRMRGKELLLLHAGLCGGITPAYAGKSNDLGV